MKIFNKKDQVVSVPFMSLHPGTCFRSVNIVNIPGQTLFLKIAPLKYTLSDGEVVILSNAINLTENTHAHFNQLDAVDVIVSATIVID